MTHLTRGHLVALALLAAVVAAEPAAPGPVLHSQGARHQAYLPRVEREALRVKQWIGPEGGTIQVQEGDLAGVRLDVPAGAVDARTLFTIEAGSAAPAQGGVRVGGPLAFGPRGLRFRQRISLTLPFSPALLPAGVQHRDLVIVDEAPIPGEPRRFKPAATSMQNAAHSVHTLSTFSVQAPLPTIACPSAEPPAGCTTLTPPTGTPGPLVVSSCVAVPSSATPYQYAYVNVVDGGTLFFVDDGGTIDFRVQSMLVEQGGAVQAGASCQPFGTYGGTLSIGLWGTDPTNQGTEQPPAGQGGITCYGQDGSGPCYSSTLTGSPHYCTGPDPTDPCASTTADSNGNNALFEPYQNMPFDDSPFGFKVLAVSYGGSLELYGAHGVRPTDVTSPTLRLAACPAPPASDQTDPDAWAQLSGNSWARLDATAAAGATELVLDRAVDWQPGDQVVVGTTDWYASHSELMTVAANDGQGTLTLTAPLVYPHSGEMHTVPAALSTATGNPNTQVDTRAAVGLLSRSITIRSLGATADEAFPAAGDCTDVDGSDAGCTFGGHVVAKQGFGTFQVQGVTFYQLGQGGRMGHYPVHFHMAKSTDYTNAFVKDSSIWDSLTRYATLHGSHDVTLARNVGFLSVGHGYYLEDGSEINNLLCQNLAVSQRPSLQEYFAAQPSGSPTQRVVPPILESTYPNIGQVSGSDSFMPVAFWLMNAYNELVGNKAVGVGGYGSCYWLLGSGVGGFSADATWTQGTNTPEDYADFNQMGTRQAPVKRFSGNSCSTSAYALQTTLQTNPLTPTDAQYTAVDNPYTMDSNMLPNVNGNFQPMLASQERNCVQGLPYGASFQTNVTSCSAAVIDRFTTSFNWGQAGFAAIWLRPYWYLFVNGAVTDQLFGGLTFVSGGSWSQSPPGYFTLTQDSVFSGSTQGNGNPWALPTGPSFDPPSGNPPNCAYQNLPNVCVMPLDGTGIFQGNFNPKRLISIYDGPFFADGNIFTNVAPFDCDPTSLVSCGAYLSTVQPMNTGAGITATMHVANAAIGWKQTNGFYYPPAFALRHSGFDSTSQRHNVIDQYDTYISGTPLSLSAPSTYAPVSRQASVTPIDFSTLLLDLDGTLTGMVPGGAVTSTLTTSLSLNHYFDAPSQVPECLSFGVQTAPTEYATTVAAILKPSSDKTTWVTDPTTWSQSGSMPFPAVPIYRQYALPSDGEVGPSDPCNSATICDGSASYGCGRGSFMMGGQTGQAPYLTANNGLYYIDTYPQGTACVPNTNQVYTPGMVARQTYALYQLFARPDTKITYQIYVGTSFDPATDGTFIRVFTHQYDPQYGAESQWTTDSATAPGTTSFNSTTGVLTVTLDNSAIASDFNFASADPDTTCMPRDLCQPNESGDACTAADNWTGTTLEDAIDAACAFWGTATGGVAPATDGLTLVDCPSGGCIGYRFTLPPDFVAQPYNVVGYGLTQCFPNSADWNVPLQVVDSTCPAPPPPSGFCP
jgi:hypothetical protein